MLISLEVKDEGDQGALGGFEVKEGQWSLGSGDPPRSRQVPKSGQTVGINGQCGAERLDPALVIPVSIKTPRSLLGLEAGAAGPQAPLRAWVLYLEASNGPVPWRAPLLRSLFPGRK